MPPERTGAFAPGRVNLIGEHTDYNQGLALPFAIAEGVTVRARGATGSAARVRAGARELAERDEFALADPPPAAGWRAFVRGVVAELARAGYPLLGARLQIGGDLPPGAGLSSSAALEVALCLALVELGGREPGRRARGRRSIAPSIARAVRARGERLGGRPHRAARPARLAVRRARQRAVHRLSHAHRRCPCRSCSATGAWWCSTPVSVTCTRAPATTSGAPNAHGRAQLLGVGSLRDADAGEAADPARAAAAPRPPRARREPARARGGGRAHRRDLPALGELLDASHASLRDDYEVSTPAVERTVKRLRDAGAAGARIVGGGFGGIVLGLFAPGGRPPEGAREVRPSAGAHPLDAGEQP